MSGNDPKQPFSGSRLEFRVWDELFDILYAEILEQANHTREI